MTEDQLEEFFEENSEEYIKFERIENPKHSRPDLCAMLMISEIQSRHYPEKRSDLISGAEHDKIFFDVDIEDIAEYSSKEELIDLIRCGIFIEEGNLAMFV
jgi:hypothetical protein